MGDSPIYSDVAIDVTKLTCSHARLGDPHKGCRKCDAVDGYLARYIKLNGAASIRWVCGWCEDYSTCSDLPTTILPAGITAADLPVRRDRRDERIPSECVVCGSEGTEFHHWAPVAIFPDWPVRVAEWRDDVGAFLCAEHHHEWHSRMRACGLRWPHELTISTW